MPVFVIIILLVIIALITYYLSRRLFQCIHYIFPRVPFYPFLILHTLGALSVVVGFFRSFLPFGASVKHISANIFAYSMGFYFYLFLFTVAIDIVALIYRLIRKSSDKGKIRFIAGILTITLTTVTVVYGFYHAAQLNIVSYDIKITQKELSRDWNIVLISDIHLGAVGAEERLEKIVDSVNSLEPDILCIAGDFFDNDYSAVKEPEKAIELLKRIETKYGKYMCLGNHDAGGSFPQMLEFIDKCEITLLNDEYTLIDDELILGGRVNRASIGGFGDISRTDTKEFLKGIEGNHATIIMDHDPANIDEYGEETDLILSGHTHNGHTFPGNIINELTYTVNYGYYQKDPHSPQVIVTSGAGTWGMPMRVGTDCEIVQITLTS